MTPRDIIQLMSRGNNPQELAMTLLQQRMGDNPMGQNLIALAQSGNTKDIEQIARNLAKQQGIDFDTEFANFRRLLGV